VTSLVVGWSLVVTRVHCGQTVHPRPPVRRFLSNYFDLLFKFGSPSISGMDRAGHFKFGTWVDRGKY